MIITNLTQDGKTPADVAAEAKHNGIAKLMREKKSRWLFPRKKASISVAADETDGGDGGAMHRSSSNSSLDSNQSRSAEEISGAESEYYSDNEQ